MTIGAHHTGVLGQVVAVAFGRDNAGIAVPSTAVGVDAHAGGQAFTLARLDDGLIGTALIGPETACGFAGASVWLVTLCGCHLGLTVIVPPETTTLHTVVGLGVIVAGQRRRLTALIAQFAVIAARALALAELVAGSVCGIATHREVFEDIQHNHAVFALGAGIRALVAAGIAHVTTGAAHFTTRSTDAATRATAAIAADAAVGLPAAACTTFAAAFRITPKE